MTSARKASQSQWT